MLHCFQASNVGGRNILPVKDPVGVLEGKGCEKGIEGKALHFFLLESTQVKKCRGDPLYVEPFDPGGCIPPRFMLPLMHGVGGSLSFFRGRKSPREDR